MNQNHQSKSIALKLAIAPLGLAENLEYKNTTSHIGFSWRGGLKREKLSLYSQQKLSYSGRETLRGNLM